MKMENIEQILKKESDYKNWPKKELITFLEFLEQNAEKQFYENMIVYLNWKRGD